MRTELVACVLLILVSAAVAQPSADDAPAIFIRGGWVWDGTGRPAIRDGVIVIKGDRIAAVGTEQEVPRPPTARLLDKRNLFLMPGLVDSHLHFSLDQSATSAGLMASSAPYLSIRAARNGRTALRGGVTTARCAGEKDSLDSQYKRAFAENLVPGPRVVVAGRPIRPTGGFPNYAGLEPPVDGISDVVRAIRDNFARGADFIKIFISGTPAEQQIDAVYFTKNEIEAIVEEAHRHHKKVAAHVYKGGPSFQWAVAAGVDSFEHGTYLTRKEMEELKQRGAFLVLVGRRVNLPGGKYAIENAEVNVRTWYTNAISSGVKLAIGVDTFHEPGALAKEIISLVEYGMSPAAALETATRNGGELTGLPVGTLEAGKYADIIGLGDNPLERIEAIRRVELVVKSGKIYTLSEE